jgi:hypothetical protein
MRFLLILLLIFSGSAFAKDKAPPSKKAKIQSNNQQMVADPVQGSADKAADAKARPAKR